MGSVVTKNSERSLVRPRRPMAETGTFEENVNVPSVVELALKGLSFRNRAICPCGGNIKLPRPESVPFASVKKNDTVASESLGLARAKPVFTEVVISAFKR